MNRGTSASAVSSRRVRIAASGAVALAVLIGGSLYLARGVFSPGSSFRRESHELADHGGRMRCGGHQPLRQQPGRDGCRRRAGGGDRPAASRRCRRAPDERRAVGVHVRSPVSAGLVRFCHRSSPAASPTGSGTVDQDGTAAAQVLALINQARAAAGLPALTVTAASRPARPRTTC